MKPPGWLGHPYTHASALLVSILAAVAVAAFMVGTLEYTKTRGQLLVTMLLAGGYFITTLAATAISRKGAASLFRPAVFATATAALALLIAGLWGEADSGGYWKTAAIITILSMGLAFTGIALSRGLRGGAAESTALASAVLSSLFTLMAVLGIALEIRIPLYWWTFALMAMLWVIYSAAVLAASRLGKRRLGK